MEVMLKKAKITNSILKQTKNSHISDIQKGRVLGFCQFEKFDFIVLHRPDINELSKFPMYRDFKIRPSQSYDDDKRRILDLHTEFIGKIAKTTSFGLVLEKEYEKIFNVGNEYKFDRLHYYCHLKNKYELSLIFIDEKPITKNGVTWFCLKEIGNGCNGDWHWLTLNQITVCE